MTLFPERTFIDHTQHGIVAKRTDIMVEEARGPLDRA